ncbi:MAG: SH3 domain-containing protein [Usitatibacter sp.]
MSLGKQRAAASAVEWDVRDVTHPLLGPIKVAVQKRATITAARSGSIVSLAFVSCQKARGRIAIELANAPENDAKSGLGPTELPRLVCNAPRSPGDGVVVKSDLEASWEIDTLGDSLARGLSPATLRRCASIDIVQNVAPPAGWRQASQRVAMELLPYGRALDAVFSACGETTAYAAEEQPVPAMPQAKAAPPAARSDSRPASADEWKPARTIAKGRTNVRSAASVDSALVTHLEPGTRILVQRASSDWWKVRPRNGARFSGYIRGDRVELE